MIKKTVAVVFLILIILCFNGCIARKEKALVASGTIEATEIQVTSERSGKVMAVKARGG